MNTSSLHRLAACLVGAGLLSCAAPAAPRPAPTAAKPAAQPRAPAPPRQPSAFERRWQSACEADGALGQCPAPFDRPGLFFDVHGENDGGQASPRPCGAGETTGEAPARAALDAKRRALRACFRGAERGAWVDLEVGGTRAPDASPGVPARTRSCAAKIVQAAFASAVPSAAQRLVVMNGDATRETAATLSKESVHATIEAHAGEVSACYDGALEVWPGLRGRLAPRVVIWFDGSVALVRTQESSLDNPALECCINTAVRGWRFDPPAGRSIAIVTLPLVLGPQAEPSQVAPATRSTEEVAP